MSRKFQLLRLLCVCLCCCLAAGSASAQIKAPVFTYSMQIGRTTFVPLVNVCLEQDIEVEWDGVTNKALLAKDGRYLAFMVGEPLVNIDGIIRPLAEAPTVKHGTFLIPAAWLKSGWWPWRTVSLEAPPVATGRDFSLRRVLIDPGHGGHDTGARGLIGVVEQNLVLDLSLQLASRLRKGGFDVYLTRSTDEFVALDRRADMVAEYDVDLFLSIHANASTNHRARGFEIYYLSEAIDDQARALAAYENSVAGEETKPVRFRYSIINPTIWDIVLSEQRRESIMLAKLMSAGLARNRPTINRGVKGAEFRVLMNSRVPALLIEVGFITNLTEARQLINHSYQRQLVLMLTQALLEYRDEYERTRGFTV